MLATQPTRPRDHAVERDLIDLAARAAGYSDDGGLIAYAEHRAMPGGVRVGVDWDQEAREELADASHYLRWGIQTVYAGFLAGDLEAGEAYERRMRALAGVIRAWHELHRTSS